MGRFFEKLPNRICYDFEIQWKGNSFLQVNFLTDKLNPFNHFGNGYSLRFEPDTVSLYRHINGNRDGNRVNSTDLVGSDVSINRNTLGNRPASKKTTEYRWQVTLVNGDVLSGDIKKISDGKLKLDTWFGGELQLKQSSLKILEPRIKPAKYIFQGPQSVRDWHFYDPSISQTVHPLPANATAIEIEEKIDKLNLGDGAWKLTKKQTFETTTAHSHIGRFFDKLPNRICYDFEIQWEGNPILQVTFLTDKLNPFNAFGNGYSLRFKPDTVSLYRHISGNRGNSTDLVLSLIHI